MVSKHNSPTGDGPFGRHGWMLILPLSPQSSLNVNESSKTPRPSFSEQTVNKGIFQRRHDFHFQLLLSHVILTVIMRHGYILEFSL